MSRVRLTMRKAADMSIPYPGNVNQPDRKDPAWDEYHTFEQRVNHELPDLRHDWQNDSRDDIGFGVPEPWGKSPTVASVRVAANKAVRIAVLLLGEKVEDEVIEAQARDLMSMSPTAMDRTLGRFADTQKLYAEDKDEADEKKAADEKEEDKKAGDDKDEDDKKAADEKEEKKAADEKVEDEKKAKSKDDEKKAEDKKDDEKKAEDKADEKSEKKAEDKKEDEKKAADDKKMPDFIKEKIEKKEDKKASADLADGKDEKKAEDKKDDEKKAAKDDEDDKKAADDKEDDKKEARRGSTEMDIELSAAADDDDDGEMDAETASQLASLFEGKDGSTAAEDVEQKPDASKKAGIKKLGGQPRVAGAQGAGAADISDIWATAPDVSDLFR